MAYVANLDVAFGGVG